MYEWRAPVWQADVDAFGELRSSVVLKLLQETATRASTDAGFDPAYYTRSGTMWLVRRTAVTLHEPVRYGDELAVRTWIADFRRVRSQRAYELRVGARLAVSGQTDWVHVGRDESRPRRIPQAMEAVFGAEHATARERVPFPTLVPPAAAFRLPHRVGWHELDALRHVNNAVYVHYLEDAALAAVAAAGWPLARWREHGGRFRALTHDLEYLDAALYEDALTIVSWTAGVASDVVTRHTLVVRDDERRPLLRAMSRYGWRDLASGAPAAMPRALHDALARGS